MVSNKGSVAHLSKKFGAEIEDAVPLLLAAQAEGLNPRGVSFHVGSQCLDVQRYVDALDQVQRVFDEAARQGLVLEMIDIGGGLPVRYENEDIDIAAMCGTIDRHYRKLFPAEVKLVAEPGRVIVGDAVILVTKVISEAKRKGKNWLYFDDGTLPSNYPTRMIGVVEKCNFCSERLAVGQMPACVEVSRGGLIFGDLNDRNSEVNKVLQENYTIRRKPELGTGPSLFYII